MGPGFMSLTSLVPAGVPLVSQSSFPWIPSLAVKKVVAPTAVNCSGSEPAVGVNGTVPAWVPLLFHSSGP